MTPSTLVPALSSSCAPALSSTPVISSASAADGHRRLTITRRGSRASTRIGTPCAAEALVIARPASSRSLAAGPPRPGSTRPRSRTPCPARRRWPSANSSRYDDERRRAPQVERHGLVVHVHMVERHVGGERPVGRFRRPQDIAARAHRAKFVVADEPELRPPPASTATSASTATVRPRAVRRRRARSAMTQPAEAAAAAAGATARTRAPARARLLGDEPARERLVGDEHDEQQATTAIAIGNVSRASDRVVPRSAASRRGAPAPGTSAGCRRAASIPRR